jgi:predicted nicotinamide N-methyase
LDSEQPLGGGMSAPQSSPAASPLRIFETLSAFHRTAALRSAIELDVFTAIGEGANKTPALAKRCAASERGIRILADYLCSQGFLQKHDRSYALSPDAAVFLDRRSPSYMGAAAAEIMSGETMTAAFAALTTAIRRGETALPNGGTLAPEHPIWVQFAQTMAAPGAFLARMLCERIALEAGRPTKLLDIAAGHGLFGITLARRNQKLEVFAVDWPDVLAVARTNAERAGVSNRFHSMPGDALSMDFGSGFDLVLITNFLPDLDATTAMLRRCHAALVENGRVALLENMLDESGFAPPAAVSLNLSLLATTRSGGTRTISQLTGCLERANFVDVELHDLAPAPSRVMLARRAS